MRNEISLQTFDLGDYHALLLTLIVVLLKRGEYLHRMDEFIQGRQDFLTLPCSENLREVVVGILDSLTLKH